MILFCLFGRAGEPHCDMRSLDCASDNRRATQIMELPDRTKFQILAPVVQKVPIANSYPVAGRFVRIRINGEVELSDLIELDKNQTHTIEVVLTDLLRSPD